MVGFARFQQITREGLTAYENFTTPMELQSGRAAMRECREGAKKAADSVRTAEMLSTLPPAIKTKIATWFGLKPGSPSHEKLYRKLRQNLIDLDVALKTRPVTLVYRGDLRWQPGHGPTKNLAKDEIFGFVHGHQAGSGYRIVCCSLFMTDHTPYYASTTIYHELTHKQLKTADHGYGDALCLSYAQTAPQTAIDNADNYAYYFISLYS